MIDRERERKRAGEPKPVRFNTQRPHSLENLEFFTVANSVSSAQLHAVRLKPRTPFVIILHNKLNFYFIPTCK